MIFDSSLEHQHNAQRNFTQKQLGPYVVVKVHDKTTYSFQELDGIIIKTPIVEKKIKAFKTRDAKFSTKNMEEHSFDPKWNLEHGDDDLELEMEKK